MNVEKNIKLLLMKINQNGLDTSLIKKTRYSKDTKRVCSSHELTVWTKQIRKGQVKNVPTTVKFGSSMFLLKALVVLKDGGSIDSIKEAQEAEEKEKAINELKESQADSTTEDIRG